MNIEIISIGNRLLLSDILDTNVAYLARQLHDAALPVVCKTTVGDDIAILLDVLQSAIRRSEIIITIGGEAGSSDGLIQRAITHLDGQVHVPGKPHHMKMGVYALMVWPRLIIASLPDKRREMAYVLTTKLLPYLQAHFSSEWHHSSVTLRVTGIAESSIKERLSNLMPYELDRISYDSYAGQTAVTLHSNSRLENQAEITLTRLRRMVTTELEGYLFGEGDAQLETYIGQILQQSGCHLAMAECGTAGNLAEQLTTAVSSLTISNITADWQQINAELGLITTEYEPDWTRWGRKIAEKLRERFNANLGLLIHKRAAGGGVQIIVTLAAPKGISITQRSFGGYPQSINDWAATLGLNHLLRWLRVNGRCKEQSARC